MLITHKLPMDYRRIRMMNAIGIMDEIQKKVEDACNDFNDLYKRKPNCIVVNQTLLGLWTLASHAVNISKGQSLKRPKYDKFLGLRTFYYEDPTAYLRVYRLTDEVQLYISTEPILYDAYAVLGTTSDTEDPTAFITVEDGNESKDIEIVVPRWAVNGYDQTLNRLDQKDTKK